MPGSDWAWLSSEFKIFVDSSCTGCSHSAVIALHDGRGRPGFQPLQVPSRRLPPYLARLRASAPRPSRKPLRFCALRSGGREMPGRPAWLGIGYQISVFLRSPKLQPQKRASVPQPPRSPESRTRNQCGTPTTPQNDARSRDQRPENVQLAAMTVDIANFPRQERGT